MLADLLMTDRDVEVRQMAAFALGETESPGGAYSLLEVVKTGSGSERANPLLRARAVEALGKITAALASSASATTGQSDAAKTEDDRLEVFKAAILDALKFEAGRRSRPDRLTILLGLTAVLRAKPDGAGAVVKPFLGYSDPRIVADALNTLARLRLKDGNDEARSLLTKHSDPIVRANAARVLGATEDKQSFAALLDRALHDSDERVVVSSIRALGSLKDARAAQPLIERGDYLLKLLKMRGQYPIEPRNELLEIATTIGILLKNSRSAEALQFLRYFRAAVAARAPEVEIAMARVNPEFYVTEEMRFGVGSPASIAQGLSEFAAIRKDQPAVSEPRSVVPWLRDLLNCFEPPPMRSRQERSPTKRCLQSIAVSPMLQAYAAFEPDDLDSMLRKLLNEKDVIVRATAAELLGGQPRRDVNTHALIEALPPALRDKDLNDAALAILDALGKQKTKEANDAIRTALDSSDQLIRRRAVALLKANGVGDFSNRIGTVQTRNTVADYRRVIARTGKRVTATVVTGKGSFTIEFLPEEAPLTVDNFIQLARKGFFNGQTIPRVVPNFVVQAGDPRGDQNGGPGYQIRCEINDVPYERAAVGMALSGKDTGGSQWFVTHSPQPHLDGGYTVFGRVISGTEVVDRIARGDHIRRVIVNER
jgi:cyclophilin family peptidyl-prolyl cis-trans isomerase/HEAT repeat protein